MRRWLVTAEVNMDTQHYESVEVEANTERKARIFGEMQLKKNYFFITNVKSSLLKKYVKI